MQYLGWVDRFKESLIDDVVIFVVFFVVVVVFFVD